MNSCTGIASSRRRSAITDAISFCRFGANTRARLVSTLASKDAAAASIVANYSADVSPNLLSVWEQDPAQAPGRQTSSPWPDRIEIGSVAQNPDGSYAVAGNVIEVTSVEEANGGVADSYAMNLTVSNVNGSWLITNVESRGPGSAMPS